MDTLEKASDRRGGTVVPLPASDRELYVPEGNGATIRRIWPRLVKPDLYEEDVDGGPYDDSVA